MMLVLQMGYLNPTEGENMCIDHVIAVCSKERVQSLARRVVEDKNPTTAQSAALYKLPTCKWGNIDNEDK